MSASSWIVVDLPREVIQADATGLRRWGRLAQREEAEVVMILGPGGTQEDRGAVAELADHLEAEGLGVEGRRSDARRARRALHG